MLHKSIINTFSGNCCWKVRLQYDNTGLGKAYAAHSELFQEYEMKPGYENGKVHYTSADGKYALAYDMNTNWMVQLVNSR